MLCLDCRATNEWLGVNIFHSIQEVQDYATQRLRTYNNPSRDIRRMPCRAVDRPNMGIVGDETEPIQNGRVILVSNSPTKGGSTQSVFEGVHSWQGFFLVNGAAFVCGQALNLRFNAAGGFDLLDAFLSDRGGSVDGQLAQRPPTARQGFALQKPKKAHVSSKQPLNGGVVTPVFNTIVACIAVYYTAGACKACCREGTCGTPPKPCNISTQCLPARLAAFPFVTLRHNALSGSG